MSTFDEDVRAQADVLSALLSTWDSQRVELRLRLEALHERAPVYLTGMGGSLAAVSVVESSLREAGRTVAVVDAGELGLYGAGAVPRGSLVIAASQTGRSRETVATTRSLRGRGVTVVGLINDTESPLAKVVDLTLLLDAGPEATNSTKTFTATQLTTLLIAGELTDSSSTPERFASLPSAVARLSETPGLIDDALDALAKAPYIAYLAHGPALSTARYGALLTKEMLAIPGEAMTVSEFRHGPVELAARGIGAVVVAPAGPGRLLALELATSIAERQVSVWLLGSSGQDLPINRPGLVVTDLGPLAEAEAAVAGAVAIQRLLASFARRLGRTPGVFEAFDPQIDTGRKTTKVA